MSRTSGVQNVGSLAFGIPRSVDFLPSLLSELSLGQIGLRKRDVSAQLSLDNDVHFLKSEATRMKKRGVSCGQSTGGWVQEKCHEAIKSLLALQGFSEDSSFMLPIASCESRTVVEHLASAKGHRRSSHEFCTTSESPIDAHHLCMPDHS